MGHSGQVFVNRPIRPVTGRATACLVYDICIIMKQTKIFPWPRLNNPFSATALHSLSSTMWKNITKMTGLPFLPAADVIRWQKWFKNLSVSGHFFTLCSYSFIFSRFVAWQWLNSPFTTTLSFGYRINMKKFYQTDRFSIISASKLLP